MNKRAIAILGAIFLLIVLTLAFIIFQRGGEDTPEETPAPTNQPEAPVNEPDPIIPDEPEPTTDKAIKLTDEEAISPVLFYQGTGIAYFNSRGQLFNTDLQNTTSGVLLSNKRELTIPLKSNINRIIWPATGNNFIAEFQNGNKLTWSLFDSSKGSYLDLPSEVISVDWLPGGDRVMLVWADSNGKTTLNTANLDLTDYQTITDMYEADDRIHVAPDGKSLLFYRTNNQNGKNIISFLSSDGKAYKAVVSEGYNLGVKWSPDSRKFLFGRRDTATQNYQLWMADIFSGEIRSLGVNTIPEKAVWARDSKTVYAAVPTKGVPASGLTEDVISKIDSSNGTKTDFPAGTVVDGQDLFLSLNEDKLFFKNKQDKALYYIAVTP